eukprot:m.182438 g.182438  ORF g.182438 m.182438 type:complete len:415 (-) comp17459_c4_seq1:72-1316(-)
MNPSQRGCRLAHDFTVHSCCLPSSSSLSGSSRSRSVDVVLDDERLGRSRAADAAKVLAAGSVGVGLGALQQHALHLSCVLRLAAPGGEGALLQGTTVGERHVPRARQVHLVDGREVEGGLLLALAAREEDNARHSRRHRAGQRAHGVEGNLARGGAVGGVEARGDHVGLEQGALQQQVLDLHGVVDLAVDALADLGARLDGVGAVGQHLGLNDGHQAGSLGDGAVAGKAPGVLLDALLGGQALLLVDLDDGAPLGEAGAAGVELLAALKQVVQASRPGLAIKTASELLGALVRLDADDDVLLLQELDQRGAVAVLAVELLLEKDDARDALLEAGGAEEHASVVVAVGLVVLDLDRVEALANRADRLVSGENALARGGDGAGRGDQLGSVGRPVGGSLAVLAGALGGSSSISHDR